MSPKSLAIPYLLMLCVGCTAGNGPCPPGAAPGIVAEIRDSVTGVPVADSAAGFVQDSAYVDSLHPGADSAGHLLTRVAAFNRPGLYDVHVTRPGYQAWMFIGAQVDMGTCAVATVRLRVRLQPGP